MTALLSLNVWYGKCFDRLIGYINECSEVIDIFCFQEMLSTTSHQQWLGDGQRLNLFSEISVILPEFIGFFAPARDWYDQKDSQHPYHFSAGLALFIRTSIHAVCSGDIFIFGHRRHYRDYDYKQNMSAPRNLQYIITKDRDNRETMIANFHGIWNGKGKTDTPERIAQSQSIIHFFDQIRTCSDRKMRKILSGDFNLRQDAKSLKMLEDQDQEMRNLIKEYSITTTRSSYYDKRKQEPHADYMLVSPDIDVLNFMVDNTEVSDHLPLILQYQ